MSGNVTYTYTLGSDPTTGAKTTPATFANGATLSGTHTVTYDSAGNIVSVSNVDLVATASGGGTTTVTALNIDPVITGSGTTHYRLTAWSPSGNLSGPFSGLDIVYNSEQPTHLSVNA